MQMGDVHAGSGETGDVQAGGGETGGAEMGSAETRGAETGLGGRGPADLVVRLDPTLARHLGRLRGVVAQGRARPVVLSWHDTPERALAAAGLGLCRQGAVWSLERLERPHLLAPPTILGVARTPRTLQAEGVTLPPAIAEVARLTGQARRFVTGGVAMELLSGRLSGPGGPEVALLSLSGETDGLAAVAEAMARAAGAQVPRLSLGAQALGLPAPGPPGSALVAAGQTVADALAHLLELLTASLLHWTDRIPAAAGPEPVHQARVAMRRLRSVLSCFSSVPGGAALAGLRARLREASARLGAARDWDVFLEDTGAALTAAFPADRRCAALLRAAARRRAACYDELRLWLGGEEYRALVVALAAAAWLRLWPEAEGPVEPFAVQVLDKRMRQVRKAGRGLETLPVEALHELRKKCKKLRYAAEFMAPLYERKPVRRFIRRLAAVQQALGEINDGATSAALMAQLGRLERSYAAGLVGGLATARATPARAEVELLWKRFRDAGPFWH